MEAEKETKIARRLLLDSVLLVAASTGTRMLLVVSLLALAPFVSADEIASYDLFVVMSSFLMILFTMGLDSGLSLAATAKTTKRQSAYIWISIAATFMAAILLYFPGQWLIQWFNISKIFDQSLYRMAYAFALVSGLITLIFSLYKWKGSALTASILVIVGSVLGIIFGFFAFYLNRSIASFTIGLLIGNATGLLLCCAYTFRNMGMPNGLLQYRYLRRVFLRLIALSLPFMATSLLLLSRRALDRGLIVAMGMTVILGPYAVVARWAEMVTFLMAAPATGLAPAFLRNYDIEKYRRLARISYLIFLIIAVFITIAAYAMLILFDAFFLPLEARHAAPLLVALIAGNLFFSETFLSGFGYVRARRSNLIPIITGMFMLLYLALAGIPMLAGYGFTAIGFGFVTAAFIYSSVYVSVSERLAPYDYPQRYIYFFRIIILGLAYASLAGWGLE